MADKTFDLEELETVFRVIVAGNRSDRLDALNIFREANSKTAVSYLTSAFVPTRGDYDTDLTAFKADVTNASGTSVTGDTAELETIFGYLLTAGRSDRLDVLNAVRTELSLTSVNYLVDIHVPNTGDRDTAYTNVEADAKA